MKMAARVGAAGSTEHDRGASCSAVRSLQQASPIEVHHPLCDDKRFVALLAARPRPSKRQLARLVRHFAGRRL
jgi:hypothetical protein